MTATPLEQKIQQCFKSASDRFINRELSWLAFNARVMEEAENHAHPLLERVKFLSISASNLNEFYMVRVAGIMDQIEHGITDLSQDGRTPVQQLADIKTRAFQLKAQQHKCWHSLQKALDKKGIDIVPAKDLSDADLQWLKDYYNANIFPAITPLALDPAHPFPFLPNLSLAVVLDLKRISNVAPLPGTNKRKKSGAATIQLSRAIIPLPGKLERFIRIPPTEKHTDRFILLEDVISLFQAQLFSGFVVQNSGLIRVIRDSELEVSDEAEDLMRTFETALKQRRRGEVIHLEVSKGLSDNVREFIAEVLRVAPGSVEEIDATLGLMHIEELYKLQRPELKFSAFASRFPERINDFGGDCFAAIKAKDIVVHHPYESFDVVVQFIRQAARDPNVVAIKQTLYRTSNDSPIVHALIEAAEAGKSVTVVVELKARFDEEANIRWGRDLERAGAQVVYGLRGLKTHAKMTLIVRREDEKLVSYAHFGTGNYHPATAKVYTDISFFTCTLAYCRDAAQLFNYLTGYSPPQHFEKVAAAPIGMRKKIEHLIDDEIAHARAGKPAAIWAKMNSLVDKAIIDKLYEASQAGVKIRLVIRGICCLRPGIAGFSDNITVKSIVGRFLEHARIFCFGNGAAMPSPDAKVYFSSADWMPRNLDRRIELLVPVENPTVHEQLLGQIVAANLKDNKQSWQMREDGQYDRVATGAEPFSAHDYFMKNPSLSGRGKALRKKSNKPKPLR